MSGREENTVNRRLEVTLEGTDEEMARFLEVLEADEGCVHVALAAASGRTIGDVVRVVGKLASARGQWWRYHAVNLGVHFKEVFPEKYQGDDVSDLHRLPAGIYLIDSLVHLAAVEISEDWIDIAEGVVVTRYARNGQIPDEAIKALLLPAVQEAVWESVGIQPNELSLKIYSVSLNDGSS